MDWNEELDEVETDREVGNIVYKMYMTYAPTQEGKEQAQREAYYHRISGYFARAMKVKVGRFAGHWACYVSYVRKGE